jgi:hypothetical protein
MTPWTIFLDAAPVLALALAIMWLPLLDDGPPHRRGHVEKEPSCAEEGERQRQGP